MLMFARKESVEKASETGTDASPWNMFSVRQIKKKKTQFLLKRNIIKQHRSAVWLLSVFLFSHFELLNNLIFFHIFVSITWFPAGCFLLTLTHFLKENPSLGKSTKDEKSSVFFELLCSLIRHVFIFLSAFSQVPSLPTTSLERAVKPSENRHWTLSYWIRGNVAWKVVDFEFSLASSFSLFCVFVVISQQRISDSCSQTHAASDHRYNIYHQIPTLSDRFLSYYRFLLVFIYVKWLFYVYVGASC